MWRAAISTLAPEVDVVIIDYGGGPSDCIDWEVETLQRLCGPEKMILAIPESGPTQAGNSLPTETESALRRRFGSSPQVVVYPPRVPRLWVQERLERVVRPAQKVVGVAALTTGDSETTEV